MKRILLLFILTAFYQLSEAQPGIATLSGQLNFLKEGDTVRLTVYRYGYLGNSRDFQCAFISKVTNHTFHFEVPLAAEPQYYNLQMPWKNTTKDVVDFLLEKGDDLHVEQSGGWYHFSGKGAAKANVKEQLLQIYSHYLPAVKHDDPAYIRQDFTIGDAITVAQLACLDAAKARLSHFTYKLMKADIIGDNLSKSYSITSIYNYSQPTLFIKALAGYRTNEVVARAIKSLVFNDSLIYSNNFLAGIIERFNFDSCYLKGRPLHVGQCYSFIKNNYQGYSRDKMISILLLSNRNDTTDFTNLFNDALGFMKNKGFSAIIKKLQAARGRGELAYNFSLPDTSGRSHALSDYRGSVVVLDFWYTGCPSCRDLAPTLYEIEKQFHNKQVVFISICIDKRKSKWINSVREQTYSSALATNVFTEEKGGAHDIIKNYQISAYPTLIVIGRSGTIAGNGRDPRNDTGDALTSLINRELK